MRRDDCIVLYPEVKRRDVESVADELGLQLHNVWESDDSGGGYEQVWATPDHSLAVNYVESSLLNLSYITVRGEPRDSWLDKLGKRLHVFTAEEVIASAYREGATHNEQVRCLSRLAAMFTYYEERALAIFEALSTQSEDVLLQEAAINAMGYRRWPEVVPLLERIAATAPVARVRNRAQRTLSHVLGEPPHA